MDGNRVDDIIKDKLNSRMEVPDQRAWDMFVLAAMEKGEEEIFDDKATDILVKDALINHHVDYDKGSWDSLLDKMESISEDPIAIQSKFDREVSNSLSGLKRKYDASSWPKLTARIEAEEKYIRHYYKAKFVEACIFIFLILSLVQLGGSGKIKSKLKSGIQSTGGIEISKALPSMENTNNVLLSTSSKSPFLVDQNKGSIKDKKLTEKLNLSNGLFGHSFSVSGEVMDKFYSNNQRDPIAEVLPLDLRPHFLSPPNASNLPSRIADLSKSFNAILLNQPLEFIHHEISEIRSLESSIVLPALAKFTLPGKWKMGAFTHYDYNEIYLPFQSVTVFGKTNTLDAKTVKSYGYGAGFKAQYVKNRMGVEFGGGYMSRSYQPNRTYFADPQIRAYFKNVSYDIVELPVAIKYYTKGETRLKAFVQAGVNNCYISKAVYDVIQEPNYASGKNGSLTSSSFLDEQTIIRATSQFTKLDKARLLIYAQGSMGLEWKLNSTIDFSTQFNYSQRFLAKKFGPNWDQGKSLSLEFGLKTTL